MSKLYLPLCMLALGVLLRSVSFELRLRAPLAMQPLWIRWFALGSLMTALAHGFVLGELVANYQSGAGYFWFSRSEEHTSELQSLMRISYAVFCLKKKKITQ